MHKCSEEIFLMRILQDNKSKKRKQNIVLQSFGNTLLLRLKFHET